ncbi:mitochondrial resolvase Ydc2 [Neurospora intermedia]|uniref:Mitochondrial resolvase Ydc2 n=1 Tax=Neurospora intermedia TaxID=5142 RepID=A0ABR3DF17_NEUIN
MAGKPSVLAKLSVGQLQELMVRCGLPKTGAKLLLYNRIRTAAREHKPLAPNSRILSIDMGLKNFAYSVLTPVMQDSKAMAEEYPLPGDGGIGINKPKDGEIGINRPKDGEIMFKRPKRGEIVDTASFFGMLEGTKDGKNGVLGSTFEQNLNTQQSYDIKNTTRRVADLHAWRHLNLLPWLEVSNIDGKNTDAVSENFAPNAMADMAYRLITEHILPQKPTHILIERQRFRTANAAGIFEWTVRVNMLESMIYAILRVMQNRGEFKGVVVAVPPKRVVNYLIDKYGHEIPTPRDLMSPNRVKMKPKSKRGFSRLKNEISPEEDKDDELLNPFEEPINVDEKETNKKIKDVKKARMCLLGSWLKNQEKLGLGNREMQRMADYFVRAVPVAVNNLLSLTKQKLRNSAVEMPAPADLPGSLGVGTLMGKREERTERVTKGEHIDKMDDLCDSVTQGLAWLEWGLQLEEAMKRMPWIMENNEEPERPKLGIPVRKRTTGGGL